MRYFWRAWYWLFPVLPPIGKGTKENPLTMEDVLPMMKALGRMGRYLDADGFHDDAETAR